MLKSDTPSPKHQNFTIAILSFLLVSDNIKFEKYEMYLQRHVTLWNFCKD